MKSSLVFSFSLCFGDYSDRNDLDQSFRDISVIIIGKARHVRISDHVGGMSWIYSDFQPGREDKQELRLVITSKNPTPMTNLCSPVHFQ